MRTDNLAGVQPSAAAIAALQMGNKIEAIKIIRREAGVDLKEAKDAVDAYIAGNPGLQECLSSKSNGGAVTWIVMLALVAAAVIYFWPKSS